MHIPTKAFRASNGSILVAHDICRGMSTVELDDFKSAFLGVDEIVTIQRALLDVDPRELHQNGFDYRSPDPHADDLNVLGRVARVAVNDITLYAVGLSISWRDWLDTIEDSLLDLPDRSIRLEKIERAYTHGSLHC